MNVHRGPDDADVPDVADVADVPDATALAELDADLPGPVAAARLRAAARTDPRAAAVLDALAATRADLAALPETPVPTEIEARWAAALASEGATSEGAASESASARADPKTQGCAGTAPDRPTDTRGRPDTAPDRDTAKSGARVRRLLMAAAVTTGLVATGIGVLPHAGAPGPAVTRLELVALGRDAVGTMDVGDLADPARRAECLRIVAPAAGSAPLLGGRRVVLDRRPGTLLVLGTGTLGRLRLVVVDPNCGTLLAHVVSG
jgi:hypothetical protein